MSTERDRVLSIVLSEAEWQAFVARHPQPIVWLRERIRDEVQRLATPEHPAARVVTPANEELSARSASVRAGC
jgi:hypothetical protein